MGHKCPVCERRFVNQAQEVCATCGPWVCEGCGNRSSFAYKRTKTPKEISLDVDALMGWGEREAGRCVGCNKIRKVGDMNLCHECSLKKVTKEEKICRACYDDGRHWLPDSSDEQYCADCGELRILNDDFICSSCFNKRKEFEKAQRHKCWNCQAVFSPISNEDKFCIKCRPACKSCGGKFNPRNRAEAFCETCVENIESGHCANCYQENKFLDEVGHCASCVQQFGVRAQRNIFCNVCEVEPVDYYSAICFTCKNKRITCPRCKENTIDAVDYICDVCKVKENE